MSGSPPVLAIGALAVGVDLHLEAGATADRREGGAAHRGVHPSRACAPRTRSASGSRPPTDPARRGAQVSLRHPTGSRSFVRSADRGVIGDFRPPDLCRFGLAPLYTRFVDLWDAVERIAEVVESGDVSAAAVSAGSRDPLSSLRLGSRVHGEGFEQHGVDAVAVAGWSPSSAVPKLIFRYPTPAMRRTERPRLRARECRRALRVARGIRCRGRGCPAPRTSPSAPVPVCRTISTSCPSGTWTCFVVAGWMMRVAAVVVLDVGGRQRGVGTAGRRRRRTGRVEHDRRERPERHRDEHDGSDDAAIAAMRAAGLRRSAPGRLLSGCAPCRPEGPREDEHHHRDDDPERVIADRLRDGHGRLTDDPARADDEPDVDERADEVGNDEERETASPPRRPPCRRAATARAGSARARPSTRRTS